LTSLGLSACFTVSSGVFVHEKFNSLKQGMTISQVSEVIGNPDTEVGEVTTASGHRVVVWEFSKMVEFRIFDSTYEAFWVYFVDGKYIKYGGKGDWQKEKSRIYTLDLSTELPPSF
jgi:hypothetical protein